MMDFVVADNNRADLGLIPSHAYLDLDIGKTNDFQLKIKLAEYDSGMHKAGNYLYCLGTEYGGRMDDPEVSTSGQTISFTGQTFRGILTNRCIEPPSDEAYKYVSGDLNECIQTIVGTDFGDIFTFEQAETGVVLTDYKFDRYTLVLDGLTKMLSSVGYRLKIECVEDINKFKAKLSAVPIVDHSDMFETSQDSGINFTIKKVTNKYNYMICLGQGELIERQVIRLHLKDDGTIEQIPLIPVGEDVKIYVYDYPNVESEDELISNGIEKFNEINGTDTQKMTIKDDLEFDIGDIVGGRDYITGMVISQPITQKIVKLQNTVLKISYTVGDDE